MSSFSGVAGYGQTYGTNGQEKVGAERPRLDKETAVGLAFFAAVPVAIIAVLVAVFSPGEPQSAPIATKTVWDAPSEGFFSALAAAGLTLDDDRSKQNMLVTGNALCDRFAQPQANKEDIAQVVLQESPGQLTRTQAMAIVEAANKNLCPAAVVPAAPVPVPVRVPNPPNLPNVPNPPNVSSGGGGHNDGESWFCRKRWWC